MSPIKITITGAAGQIGYALLFRIASGQMFGASQEVELRLLELEAALPALKGVAMELEDGAFPLLKNIVITSDVKKAFAGTHFALLVGSVPRKAGMERADLLKINGAIFKEQGRAINEGADSAVRVLVVGNPCNTNALIAAAHAPDVPRDRFFAMTMLDENRARIQLALKAQVPVATVKKLAIWGNHSATQYPDFFHATIQGKPVSEVISDQNWLKDSFLVAIQQRGAEIIKARGASSAASAANAIIDTVVRLTTETSVDNFFSVARSSLGEYNIPEGLIFSYPCQMRGGKVQVVTGLEHNPFSQEKIRLTTEELQAEYKAVKELGLI